MRFNIHAHTFKTAIQWVAQARATEDNRPVLTGVQFKWDGIRLGLYAADGYMCNRYEFLPQHVQIEGDDAWEFILNVDGWITDTQLADNSALEFQKGKKTKYAWKWSLQLLLDYIKQFGNVDSWLEFDLPADNEEVNIRLASSTHTVPMMRISGNFPDADRVFNQEFNQSITATAILELTHDAKSGKKHTPTVVDCFAERARKKDATDACLHLYDLRGTLAVDWKNSKTKDWIKYISPHLVSGSFDAHFNAFLLHSALRSYEEIHWTITLTSKSDPMFIHGGEQYRSAIMPMILNR